MVANGIAAAYSFVQVLRCVVSMVRGNVLVSKALAWAIFSGDQVHYFIFQTSYGPSTLSHGHGMYEKLKDTAPDFVCTLDINTSIINRLSIIGGLIRPINLLIEITCIIPMAFGWFDKGI